MNMKSAKLIAAAVVVAGATAPVGHAANEIYFRTPDRNIECAMFQPSQADTGNVTCIMRSTATARKPWLAWSLDSWRHVAVYRFGQRVVATPVRTLGYGQTLRRGFFRCSSRKAGLTCISINSRHGFLDQSAEEVAAAEVSGGASVGVGGRVVAVWGSELERAVRPVLIVVPRVHAQDAVEMSASEDEDAIEAVAAYGACRLGVSRVVRADLTRCAVGVVSRRRTSTARSRG